MRIEYDIKLGFKDVMFRPKRSTLKSRSQVNLERTFKMKHSTTEWSGVPIMAANMDTVGTFEMALALSDKKLFTAIHKHYSVDEWNDFLAKAPKGIENYIALSTGTGSQDFDKIARILSANPQLKYLCIDVANGYSEHFVSFVKQTRKKYHDKVIIAGNVVTGEMVEELLLAGADIIKVGIGPGSICTTRVVAGIGVPQITAIMDSVAVASKHGIPIVADGGIKHTGDVAKAIAAGADSIMIGNLLAGHEESPGDKILYEGRAYKLYRGMGSLGAMHQGSADRYFQDPEEDISKLVPEGIEGRVAYKGNVGDTIYQITGGLRASMGYCGCHNIDEMKNKAPEIFYHQKKTKGEIIYEINIQF